MALKTTTCMLIFALITLFLITSCIQYGSESLSTEHDTGLRKVAIDTGGKEVTSRDDYIDASITVYKDNCILIDASGEDQGEIKGRGNSSWMFYPKKPYTLKFPKGQRKAFGEFWTDTTVGTKYGNKVKKLALIANYLDPTMMRNDLAYFLAGAKTVRGVNVIDGTSSIFNMPWTVNHEFADVYLNGYYNGVYLMTDHTQNVVKAQDISDLNTNIGFLVEYDEYYDEDPKFRTLGFNLPAMVKAPDWDEVTDSNGDEIYEKKITAKKKENKALYNEQKDAAYQQYVNDIVLGKIKPKLDGLEDALKDGDWSSVTAKADVDSIAKFFLIYNLMGVPEPGMPRSTFLYSKNEDDIIHFGPVWDFDAYSLLNPDDELLLTGSWYFGSLLKRPEFKQMVKNCWAQLKSDGYIKNSSTDTPIKDGNDFTFLKHVNKYLDKQEAFLEKGFEYNKTVWDTRSLNINEQFQTFSGYIEHIKDFMQARSEHLDVLIKAL